MLLYHHSNLVAAFIKQNENNDERKLNFEEVLFKEDSVIITSC